jgi:thiol-disulfide isomerase/thioredoxin
MEQLLIANSIVLWLVLLGHVLLTFALVRKVNGLNQASSTGGQPMTPREFLKVGQPAPDFAAETLGGEPVTLADYAGRKVAFLFMSPGCAPCREAIPTLEELQPRAAQTGVSLNLVMNSNREQAQAFVSELGVSLPVLVTPPAGQFKADYKVGGTPFYCLVDEHGQVEATGFFDDAWRSLTRLWGDVSRQDSVPALAMVGHDG